MTINKLGSVALTSMMLSAALAGGVAAASATADGVPPNAAYFAVSVHYCAPPAIVLTKTSPAPTGAAAIVYEEVLMGTYGGDCEDFRAKEVLPRLYLSHEGS
jgi:hypothetical protein